MRARLKNSRWEAEGINSYILEPVDGGLMPAFEPGAHVDHGPDELGPGVVG